MLKDGCPGSRDIKQPKPEDITCRKCGKEIEIFAKECVGEEKYRRIKAGAGSKN
jgi:hypothetical protein